MDGGVEKGLDKVVPKLLELFETFGYDVAPSQILMVFDDCDLEIVSREDYEDYLHGE